MFINIKWLAEYYITICTLYDCAVETCYSFPTKCLLHILNLVYTTYIVYASTLYSLYSIRYAPFTTVHRRRCRFVSTSYGMTVYKILKCIYVTCYVIPAIYSGTYISYIVHVYMSIMSLHYMFLILYRKT